MNTKHAPQGPRQEPKHRNKEFLAEQMETLVGMHREDLDGWYLDPDERVELVGKKARSARSSSRVTRPRESITNDRSSHYICRPLPRW